MKLSCEDWNSSQVYLVEIYNGMFRHQVRIGLLSLILVISINEVELWRLEPK